MQISKVVWNWYKVRNQKPVVIQIHNNKCEKLLLVYIYYQTWMWVSEVNMIGVFEYLTKSSIIESPRRFIFSFVRNQILTSTMLNFLHSYQ